MKNDTKKISVTDANEDFSKVSRIADFVNVDMNPQLEMSEEEKIIYLGKRILAQHIEAFKELAKWLRE